LTSVNGVATNRTSAEKSFVQKTSVTTLLMIGRLFTGKILQNIIHEPTIKRIRALHPARAVTQLAIGRHAAYPRIRYWP
jgi:hypothetical protein